MIGKHIVPSLLAATLACGVLQACAGDSASLSPLAPSSASSHRGGDDVGNDSDDDSDRKFIPAKCETRRTARAFGVFGPQGGTLLFGTSRLIIPAGALRDTVTISATIPDSDNSRVEFRPSGLRFAKAAGLLLDTSGCSLDGKLAPDVVYLSESGAVLETITATYSPRWKTIAAAIWHFSGYAIAF